MELYFGNDFGDSLVPRDQKPLDRLPSPNSWSQWGVSESRNSMFPAKGLVSQTNSLNQELYFDQGNHYEQYLQENNSSSSSMYQGFAEGSSGLATTNTQMDDIFLDSFLEEDSKNTGDLFGQSDLFPEYHHGMFAENNLSDMIEELDNGSRYFGMETSDTPGRLASTPSAGRSEEEVHCLHMPHHSREKYDSPNKVPVATGSFKLERSVDLDVLQEFERVVTQLSGKSRLCYRDSMYRLAKNSKMHVPRHSSEGDENPASWPVHEETSRRQEEVDSGEAETNAIDRTVANLMFCKIDDSGTQEGATEPRGYHDYNSSLCSDTLAQRRKHEA